MNLIELVTYRDKIKQHTLSDEIKWVADSIAIIKNDIDSAAEVGFEDYTYQFEQNALSLNEKLSTLRLDLTAYLTYLDDLIVAREQAYIIKSEAEYYRSILTETLDQTTERVTESVLSDSGRQELMLSISRYANPNSPGLHIGPIQGALNDSMAALVPLYLADIDQSLLDPIKERFNPIYKHRVMYYIIPKRHPKVKVFAALPQEQFGFILAYNYVNRLSLKGVNDTLLEIWNLLKPGGVFLFTFTDSDLPENILMFDLRHVPYTPGRLIKAMIKEIGYEIIAHINHEHFLTWFEIKKPGQITTLRGGESLAKVHTIDATIG